MDTFSTATLLHENLNPEGEFSPSASPEITSHSMKNSAFHSLLKWKMIILPILNT